jgi:hypothetical protein
VERCVRRPSRAISPVRRVVLFVARRIGLLVMVMPIITTVVIRVRVPRWRSAPGEP